MATAGAGPKAIGIGGSLAAVQIAGGIVFWVASLLVRRPSKEPLLAAGIGAVATVGVALLSGTFGAPLGFRFAPGQDQGQVALAVELPAGASLQATQGVLAEIERSLADIPEIKYLETSAGQSATGGFGGTSSTGTNYGQVRLTLVDRIGNLDKIQFWTPKSGMRLRADTEIAEEVRARVKGIAGASIRTTEVSGFGGASAPVQIEIVGPDLDELVRIARSVRDILEKTDGILTPDISYKASKPEVQVRLDRARAAEYGLSVQQVAQAMRDAVEGNTDAKFRTDCEQYDIRVQYEKSDRAEVEDIGGIVVGLRDGVPIRVRDVASTIEGRGPTKIDRKNRLRQVTVSAYLAPGKVIGNMQQVIDPRIQEIDLGKATYEWGGEANSIAEEGVFMVAALGLAIGLVYMLMAALFNNLLYPLVIMLSIPQALVGGLLGLLITGKPLSIIAMIGVIMLMGLVTKNAILLVDYTNTLRSRGWRRDDALAEAGPTRLRPILMTSLAQILGALPIALALGRGSEFRQPLGIVVMGGLILSGLLTLLVIPCTYTLFDDISSTVGRVFRMFARRSR
ncbi:MAG: efflux RND transporter permease subunit [Armatimonadota bacterium]